MEESQVPVDAHVHFHPGFELVAWLDAAHRNFIAAAGGARGSTPLTAYLMLTESHGVNRFAELRSAAPCRPAEHWTLQTTTEPTSLIAEHEHGSRIVIVAGRQIAAREGLEVLALNLQAMPPDGNGFEASLDDVRGRGATAVVPWGFGKWWFARGRLVERAIRARRGQPVYLGDNSGRPALGAPPKLFGVAAGWGTWTLPGSDPLPFGPQVSKVGRYGFYLAGIPDLERPAHWVTSRIAALSGPPPIYGRRERLADFCRLQVAMQWRKRVAPRLS